MSNNPLNKDEFYLENFLKSDLYKDLEKIPKPKILKPKIPNSSLPKPNKFKFGNKSRETWQRSFEEIKKIIFYYKLEKTLGKKLKYLIAPPCKINFDLNLNLKQISKSNFETICTELQTITNFDYIKHMITDYSITPKNCEFEYNKPPSKFKFGNDGKITIINLNGSDPTIKQEINNLTPFKFYKLEKINGIPNLISYIFPTGMENMNTSNLHIIKKLEEYYGYNLESKQILANTLFKEQLKSGSINDITVIKNINNDLFISKDSDMINYNLNIQRIMSCYTHHWDEPLNGSLSDPENYYNTIPEPVLQAKSPESLKAPLGCYLTYPRWENNPRSCKILKDVNPINTKEELQNQVDNLNIKYTFIFATKCALTGSISQNLLQNITNFDNYNNDIQVFFRPSASDTVINAIKNSNYPPAIFGIFNKLYKGSKKNYNWEQDPNNSGVHIYQVNQYISTTVGSHLTVKQCFWQDYEIGITPENPGYIFRYNLAPGIPYISFDNNKWISQYDTAEVEVLLMRGCYLSTKDPIGKLCRKKNTISNDYWYYRIVDINIMWPYVKQYINNIEKITIKPKYEQSEESSKIQHTTKIEIEKDFEKNIENEDLQNSLIQLFTAIEEEESKINNVKATNLN